MSEKGMTLIEVVVTVVILTMLTSLATLSVGFYLNEGKARIATGDLTTLKAAVRLYILDKGVPPPNLAALVNAYLPELPEDPFAAAPTNYHFINDSGTIFLYSVGPNGNNDIHSGDDIVVQIAIP